MDKSIRTVYISDFLSQLLEQLKRKQIKSALCVLNSVRMLYKK